MKFGSRYSDFRGLLIFLTKLAFKRTNLSPEVIQTLFFYLKKVLLVTYLTPRTAFSEVIGFLIMQEAFHGSFNVVAPVVAQYLIINKCSADKNGIGNTEHMFCSIMYCKWCFIRVTVATLKCPTGIFKIYTEILFFSVYHTCSVTYKTFFYHYICCLCKELKTQLILQKINTTEGRFILIIYYSIISTKL